jgi:hypothetical protein
MKCQSAEMIQAAERLLLHYLKNIPWNDDVKVAVIRGPRNTKNSGTEGIM